MTPDSKITLRGGRGMPILGLGTWQLTNDTAATVRYALELGYRMIDTSGDYGTQPGIGAAIDGCGIEREQLYVVTKVEETGDAYAATRKNLTELGLDYADLMLIHRPPDEGAGVELWEGLLAAKRDGLTKDIGVSSYDVGKMCELEAATDELPAVNQVEWTPFGRGAELFGFCREHRIVIQAYSPLTRAQRLDDAALVGIADRYGKTAAQILIRWNLQLGTVPLPKANRHDHLRENIDVFDFAISEEEMARLNELNERYSSLGSLPYE